MTSDRASLSSMWTVRRFDDFGQFIDGARRAGFDRIELNYEASPAFCTAARHCGLPVTSLHVPLPAHLLSTRRPHYEPSLTASDEDEREVAVRLANGTIDLAADLAAASVVVHLGGIPEARDVEYELRGLYLDGQRIGDASAGGESFREKRDELAARRASCQPPYLDAGRRSLDAMLERAARRAVRVGLETRHHVYEIPNIDEMGLLLAEFEGSPVGYWHDAGHVEQGERLGFASHEAWLQRHADRMIGAHLHDIVGLADHRAPGLGDMPWPLLRQYLPDGIIRTCEFGGFNDEAAISAGLELLHREGIVAG